MYLFFCVANLIGMTIFRQWLEYFGSVYGVPVIAVVPHYTSQDCSNCGALVVKTLSTRTHNCPKCGFSDTRDGNSAKNILKKALEQLAPTVGHTESNASGEILLCSPLEIMAGKRTRRKRNLSQ